MIDISPYSRWTITRCRQHRVSIFLTDVESVGCIIKILIVRTNNIFQYIYQYKSKKLLMVISKRCTMRLSWKHVIFIFFICVTCRELFLNFQQAATRCYLKATSFLGLAFFLLMINTLYVSFCIHYSKANMLKQCLMYYMFLFKLCFLCKLRLDSPRNTLISSNYIFIEYISFSQRNFFMTDFYIYFSLLLFFEFSFLQNTGLK